MKHTIKAPSEADPIQYQDLEPGQVFMFEPKVPSWDNAVRVMISEHGDSQRHISLTDNYLYSDINGPPLDATVRLYDAELVLTQRTQ